MDNQDEILRDAAANAERREALGAFERDKQATVNGLDVLNQMHRHLESVFGVRPTNPQTFNDIGEPV